MDSQELMELLRKEIRAYQAKMDADGKTDKEEMLKKMRAWGEKLEEETRATLSETEAIKARTRAIRESMGTSHKEMVAETKPEMDAETMACQEMEAHQEEKKPTSSDRKPEAAQKTEVPAENATVMPVREPKKERRRDRKLAAEHRRQKPSRRATVARRTRDTLAPNMTRSAKVARRKEDTSEGTASGTTRLGKALQEEPSEGGDSRWNRRAA
jgi:outer membrane biosynthesis protein TonB